MSGNQQRRFTDEFKREAVRLTMTSGRSVERVANDLSSRACAAGTRDPEESRGFFRQGGKSMRFSFVDAREPRIPGRAPLQSSRSQPE